jgi:hypothetical protein
MGKKLKRKKKNQGHIISHHTVSRVLDLLRHKTINSMQTLINKLAKKVICLVLHLGNKGEEKRSCQVIWSKICYYGNQAR